MLLGLDLRGGVHFLLEVDMKAAVTETGMATMATMVLAGINMMYFHFFTYRTVEHWDLDPSVPFAAKFAGALSLLFWIAVALVWRFWEHGMPVYAAALAYQKEHTGIPENV